MDLYFLARRSLKSRVTLFTLAIFLLCIWTLAFYGRAILHETMQRSLGEQQLSTASFIAAGVDHELDDHLKTLEAFAATLPAAALGNAAALQALLDQQPVFQKMLPGRIFSAGRDGVAIDARRSPAEGKAWPMDADLIAAALAGRATIGRPAAGAGARTPLVGMAVPVRDGRGAVIGALGAVSDLSKSSFLATLAHNDYGKVGNYLLIAPRQRLVVMAGERQRMMQVLPAAGRDAIADRLIDGSDGAGLVVDRAGVEMLASRKTVPAAGWYVALALPTEEAFTPFRAARRRMLLATVTLSLLAAALTWWMLRRQLAPLLSASRTLASHSQGDLALQPLPIGCQDEIGDLIASFNRLLDTLRLREQALTASEERFRCLSQMSADFYWESDAAHRLIRRDDSHAEADEPSAPHGAPLGLRRWDTPSLSPDQAGWQAHRATLDAHLPFRHFEVTRQRSDGAVRHVSISGDPVFDRHGAFQGYRGVGADITARKQIALALIASERRLATVLDGVQSAVVTTTEHGVVESFNQSAVQIFGYSAAEVIGRNVSMLMPAPYRNAHDGYLERYRHTGVRQIIGQRRDLVGQRKDGSTFPIELGLFETQLNERRVLIGSISDLSFRKQAEAELRIAATAFDSLQGMLITDADCVILRVNQAFTDSTGYSAGEVLGQTPRLLKSGRHDADFYRAMWESIARTGGWQGEIWDRRKNGEVYPKWLTITAVRDDDDVVTHYVGAHFDITDRKQKEEQVRQLAFYDTLTALPNRRLLDERLGQALLAAQRSRACGALLFLDLDNFKSLNDTHGHAVGDLLLIDAAQRLKQCVRECDTVARFGGDELVVLLSDLSGDAAEAAYAASLVADKIRLSLSHPYVLTVVRDGVAAATVKHRCTASIGVALFGEREASQEAILKRADAAMYGAKQGGGNAIRFDGAGMHTPLGVTLAA